MEYFNFEQSEFQILEDFEFDEEIQRPSEIRFYTLDEQLVDTFEKLIPKERATRFRIEKIRKEVERIKELYSAYVEQTPEDYRLREADYTKVFDWVYPVYSTDERKEYSFERSWLPLYENVSLPNFYPRMVSALPRPYIETQDGNVYPIESPTEFLNSSGHSPLRALPTFTTTRTQFHEDRSFDVLRVPIAGTADSVPLVGYYLAKRPLDIPNPLPEHPFFKANESTFIETTSPLQDVAPSLETVMTHGVPVSTDPYGEAMPYMKLYNIRPQDIPWNVWKSKFPAIETDMSAQKETLELQFPTPQSLRPSENIIQEYKREYFPGISPRLWLMQQEDGGELIIQMLLSKAIDNGSVETVPDLSVSNYPETTVEECALNGLNFQDFTLRGVLRRKGEKYTCVPVEFIKQERARAGYLNRLPWKETTAFELLDSYRRKLILNRRIQPLVAKSGPESKTPARPESEKRKEVLLVESDPNRFAEDKLRDIQELLKDTTLTNNIYSDTAGEFVLCSHTLALLSGEFIKDKNSFYDTWCARDDGFRVCKFCGERVSSLDLVNQTEYDDSGFVINQTETLVEKQAVVLDSNFTNDLQKLSSLFVLQHPTDSTLLLFLSVLHVLPRADVLEPYIKMGRAFANKQFGDKETDQVKKFKGIVGIVMAVLLLQTHIPLLVPRRSFGSKPVLLSGYPRDADAPAEYSILDSLLMVIRKTFEAFPTSFKGPPQQVVRAILNKPSEIKNAVRVLLDKTFLKDKSVQDAMEKARAYVAQNPPTEDPNTLIPIVYPPKQLGTVQGFPKCVSERPIFTNPRAPSVEQKTVALRNGIQASVRMQEVVYSQSQREIPVKVPKATIQARLQKKVATKFPIRDPYITNVVLASHIADLNNRPLPVRTVDPTQQVDELRDVAKGLLYESLANTNLETLRKKDPTLYTLTADYLEEKAGVNKLRAQERLKFVQEMALRSDQEREIMGDLLKIGIAPYIITIKDREAFAQEAEVQRTDEELLRSLDVGVGQPVDFYDQGELPIQGNEDGNYGDYQAQPSNDGRDPQQPVFWDDDNPPI